MDDRLLLTHNGLYSFYILSTLKALTDHLGGGSIRSGKQEVLMSFF